jgi:hypothetical protein
MTDVIVVIGADQSTRPLHGEYARASTLCSRMDIRKENADAAAKVLS